MEPATSAGRERPVIDSDAALRFLADASSVLAGSLDYEDTLRRVAQLLVPELADWCGIDVLQDDGSTRQITSGLEPELEGFLMELRRRYRTLADQSQGTAAALREGHAVLVQEVEGELPAGLELSDEERVLYDRLGARSYMIVPLIARGRTLGALTILSRRAHYSGADLAFAEHLARRFALAIDNARLYDEAERSFALLDTLFATAPVGLAFFDTELRYVRINGALAAINGLAIEDHLGRTLAEVLPEADAEIADVVRRVVTTGEPATDVELRVATQREPGMPRLFNASFYPVRAPESAEVIGVGAVVADITERQRAQIELAQALEREREARAAAEIAEQRARFLAEASALLDASLDYETTLQNVARLVVANMADWCGVDVVEQNEPFRPVAVAHRDPKKVEFANALRERYPPDFDSETGVPQVIRSGRSELYAQIPSELVEAQARDDEHLRLIRELDLNSVMIVPMVARGRTLGAITFVSAESARTYDDSDLALAEELGRRAAMATDNARLYTELSGIADTLQAELLPTQIPDIPGIDVAVRYRAAGELNRVGGDFYDVFRRAPNEWAIVIGDVSGKGAPAAAVTALARYTLRTAAASASAPSQALDALNEALLERRRDQEFCSVALAFVRLDDEGLEVTLSLGGHPHALVRRRGDDLDVCGTPGLLLGFAHDPPLSDDSMRLAPGDTLLLYTDGVTDAARDGDRLGDERLRQLVRGFGHDLPASVMAETIEESAVAHADYQPQDDMALVAVQVPETFVSASQFNVGGGPEAIGRARNVVVEFLERELEPERVYDIQLLVSEVVTNAVRHGGARHGEQVDVRIALTAERVRLEVRDPGPGFHDMAPPELPDSDRGGGYGLYLVDLYASDWGVSDSEGTCVWFELPRAGSGPAETV
jgi:PAS domain S-box-containing protein